MTIQDDRTTNFSLKKPYPTNLLADDVLRLREALDLIDAALEARPTSSSVQGVVDAAVAALVASAPATLDTLNELAAALGDDANFSTTVTNEIAAAIAAAAGAQETANSKASLGLAIALG